VLTTSEQYEANDLLPPGAKITNL